MSDYFALQQFRFKLRGIQPGGDKGMPCFFKQARVRIGRCIRCQRIFHHVHRGFVRRPGWFGGGGFGGGIGLDGSGDLFALHRGLRQRYLREPPASIRLAGQNQNHFIIRGDIDDFSLQCDFLADARLAIKPTHTIRKREPDVIGRGDDMGIGEVIIIFESQRIELGIAGHVRAGLRVADFGRAPDNFLVFCARRRDGRGFGRGLQWRGPKYFLGGDVPQAELFIFQGEELVRRDQLVEFVRLERGL